MEIQDQERPILYSIWYKIHRGIFFFILFGLVLFLANLYIENRDSNSYILVMILTVIFFVPAGLAILVVVRFTTKSVHSGKKIPRLIALFTDFILVALGLIILQEFVDGVSSSVSGVIMLFLILIFPLFTVITLVIDGSTREFLNNRGHIS